MIHTQNGIDVSRHSLANQEKKSKNKDKFYLSITAEPRDPHLPIDRS